MKAGAFARRFRFWNLIGKAPSQQGKPLWIVWYPVYGTNPKDTMLHRLYADCAVLAANGIDVSSIRFICLRSDLISDPDLKADEIFTVYESSAQTARGISQADSH